MKAILTTIAIATLTLLGSAPDVQARPYHHAGGSVFVSGYRSCGTPIYSERYLVGYDRCGAPVWGIRPVRQTYYRPVAQPRYIAPCPQPYRGSSHYYQSTYRRPQTRSSIVIQGCFGR